MDQQRDLGTIFGAELGQQPGYVCLDRTVNGKTVTRTLTQAQYDTYASRFASARRLRTLAAELEALSLKEMARPNAGPR